MTDNQISFGWNPSRESDFFSMFETDEFDIA